jgi:methionyl aminopeptidase
MRQAGLVVAAALQATAGAVRAGITTAELDAVAAEVIRTSGATPSFLDYHGFPAVTCISVNSEVVHGIPGPRVLAEGDSVSIDCGAIVAGWHGDSAVTVQVGAGSEALVFDPNALFGKTVVGIFEGNADPKQFAHRIIDDRIKGTVARDDQGHLAVRVSAPVDPKALRDAKLFPRGEMRFTRAHD